MKIKGIPIETLIAAYQHIAQCGDLTDWSFRLNQPEIKIACERPMGGRMKHRLRGKGWTVAYTLNDDERTGIRAYPGTAFETVEFGSRTWRVVGGSFSGDEVAFLRDLTELKMHM